MGQAARRTDSGFEVSKGFAAFIVSAIAILTFFVGVTAATVRASDQIKAAAPRAELHDSVRAIRRDELVARIADSVHEAHQDSLASWYARQTWLLVCDKEGNPRAFCSQPSAGLLQAGRPK
jgi:hypothetical protein